MNKTWIKKKYQPQDKEYQKITQIANQVFDSYMTRVMMTALLNRNVDKNHIVKILAQQHQEEQEEEQKRITLATKPKQAIANEENE